MAETITNDFYRIEVPLPLSGLDSVNCYVIKGAKRNFIIDTGMYNHICIQAMEQELNELKIDLRSTDFFVTHCHRDHFGLMASLMRNGSTIYISRPEAAIVDKVRSGAIISEWSSFMAASGFPEDNVENIFPAEADNPYRTSDPFPFSYVQNGDTLKAGNYEFTCVATPGHSKGHMCLHEPHLKVFVSGDHLLYDITPSIQARNNDEDPLNDYLSSLDKVLEFNINFVLPGHRRLFGNFRDRINELKLHHKKRAGAIISILEGGGKDAYQLATQIEWDTPYDSWQAFPIQQKFFATGEVFAHLRYLEMKGVLSKRVVGKRIVFLHNNVIAYDDYSLLH